MNVGALHSEKQEDNIDKRNANNKYQNTFCNTSMELKHSNLGSNFSFCGSGSALGFVSTVLTIVSLPFSEFAMIIKAPFQVVYLYYA